MEELGKTLPFWSMGFFVALLLAIAVFPLALEHFWESNRNKAIIAGILSVPVLILFGYHNDFHPIIHSLEEFISFIVLLGSLFVISGGIFLSGDIQATPRNNTIFLAIGAVIANLFGTTGAAMLLIRPVLRTNSERNYVYHIPIFFIFIVCNIGGLLTPIGDPPLFMGYLRGVPFFWTLRLIPQWLIGTGIVLLVFYLTDRHFWNKESEEVKTWDVTMVTPIGMRGKINVVFIIGIMLSVILLRTPMREGTMIAMSILSLVFTPKGIREDNEFNYAPIIEVAVLFAGIFITMVPVLLILEARGAEFGITKPWHFFWVTGGLSSFLDNTPTYLTFFSLAKGLTVDVGLPAEIVGMPARYLEAISVGAVFMGANTYIGNGPNFMVKVICEHQKVKVPSFFGYMLWSGGILIPIFVVITFVFFR
ncbi:sodium:proton antiporter [Candidatus Poribacteria bacterium]|nr:sodium:proton antiporter [Candidatus Poribacteria bacterium]